MTLDLSKYSAEILRKAISIKSRRREWDNCILIGQKLVERSEATFDDLMLLGKHTSRRNLDSLSFFYYDLATRSSEAVSPPCRSSAFYQRARARCNMAHEKCPEQLDELLHLAIQDYTSALDIASAHHPLDEVDAVTFSSRASALNALLIFGDAISDYQRSLSISETSISQSGLSVTYAYIGRRDLSEASFRKTFRLLEGNEEGSFSRGAVHSDRGNARLLWGEYSLAEEDFTQSIHYFSDDTFVGSRSMQLWRRSFARFHLNDFEGAQSDLEESHRLNPGFPTIERIYDKLPHLPPDFELFLQGIERTDAVEALELTLPRTDRAMERFEFLSKREEGERGGGGRVIVVGEVCLFLIPSLLIPILQ